MNPFEADSLLVNGHCLYFERYGAQSDPAVVFLHHGLGSTWAWKDQYPAITRSGFQAVAYDRWGYGRSDPRVKLALPYFNDDLVDLRELINRLGIASVMLVGHSDGGTLALLYAAQQSGQVACLVVVAAHIYIELEGKRGIEGIRYQFENDLDFQEKLQRIHGDRYKQVFYNWYHGWHNPEVLKWDLRPVISKITCPALIIQGMQDEHASPGHARDIAGTIPGAEIWLPPGVGHMLPQDAAEDFNNMVIGFLKKVPKIV